MLKQEQIANTFDQVVADQQAIYANYLAQEEADIENLLNRGIIDIDEAQAAYEETADRVYADFLTNQEAVMAEFEQMLVDSQTQEGVDRESLRDELAAAGIDYGLVAEDLDFLDRQAAQTRGAQGDYLANIGRIGEQSQYDRELAGQRMFGGARTQAQQAARQEMAAARGETRAQQRALDQMAVSAEQLADTFGVDAGELLSGMIAGVDLPGIMESRRAQEAQIAESQRAQEAQIEESARQFDATFGQNNKQFEDRMQLDRDRFEQDKLEYGEEAAFRDQTRLDGLTMWWQGHYADQTRFDQEISQRDEVQLQRMDEFAQEAREFTLNYDLALDDQEWQQIFQAQSAAIDRDHFKLQIAQLNLDEDRWNQEAIQTKLADMRAEAEHEADKNRIDNIAEMFMQGGELGEMNRAFNSMLEYRKDVLGQTEEFLPPDQLILMAMEDLVEAQQIIGTLDDDALKDKDLGTQTSSYQINWLEEFGGTADKDQLAASKERIATLVDTYKKYMEQPGVEYITASQAADELGLELGARSEIGGNFDLDFESLEEAFSPQLTPAQRTGIENRTGRILPGG